MFANIKPLKPRDIFGKYVLLRCLLRVTAVLLTFVMAGEVIPAPLYAAAGSAAKQFVTGKVVIAKQQVHSYEVMQNLREKMASVKPANFVELSRAAEPAIGPSIIDEIGRLSRPISMSDASKWRDELHQQPALAKISKIQVDYFAQRHLWLGEYLLAADKQPNEAAQQFRAAYLMTNNADSFHGQACYDLGLSVYWRHNFRETVEYYQHMLQVKPEPAGLDRANAALMLRHAIGCDGYHRGNARLGIPEPPILDPLCGAAALAASLKHLGVAYDAKTVLASCKVTEEGSSLNDLVDAGHKLGAAVYQISADDKGLQLMPKPAIAFVEQDHFVSVIRADKKGVAYLCSDCGAWPGGEVDLTWNQWHHMEPGIYGAVVRPGSEWNQFLAQLPSLRRSADASRSSNIRLSSTKFQSGTEVASLATNNYLKLTSSMSSVMPVAELIAHLAPFVGQTFCGASQDANHCTDPTCCPKGCSPGHGGGSGGGGKGGKGGGGGKGSPGGPPSAAPMSFTTEMGGGPGAGDPVNLATGEEEYTPDNDLVVYNPIGPQVNWGRSYNSLRSAYYETWYEFQDFGQGWTQNYNMGVNDPTNGGSGSSAYKYIYMPNGGRILFTAPSIPSASNTVVQCQVQTGYPYLVSWNYNSANGSSYYIVTDQDRTKYVTTSINSSSLCSVLAAITDRNGNSIDFNYSAPLQTYDPNNSESWPLLTSITDSNGSPLLVINRAQDGSGAITSVDDRYGRTVYYHVGYYHTLNVPNGYSQYIYDCDHVSQIEPTDTANPPDRYHYGYSLVTNGESSEEVAKLTSISVPNPTGASIPSTATIAYSTTTGFVSQLTDGNGNETSFETVDQYGNPASGTNYEKVTVVGANMPQGYSYTVNFNGSMSQGSYTDGVGNMLSSKVYGDASNPYSPTTDTDARGNVWTYTYTPQGYGDAVTTTTPRGTTTTYVWNYSNFGLGEVTQEQDSYIGGGTTIYKAPTSYTYYEPSGNYCTFTEPTPGTVNSSTGVTYHYYYNSLGCLTERVTPGNNSTSTITDTLDYGSAPRIGEVLSATDGLGHTKTFTYDNQGNMTSWTDALGNTVCFGNTSGANGYNIANQNVLVTFSATGETGTGNSFETTSYQYPGGEMTSTQAFDESGSQVRQVNYTYGSEGEKLTVSGSTEFAAYVYDAVYRLHTVTDANANVTSYYYNALGYLDSVTFPGYRGPTPAFNTSTGSWSNVTGADSIRNAAYDAEGDVLTHVDGRGVTTSCTYNDPENKLTGVSYSVTGTSVPVQPNVSLTYDGFGRVQTVNNGVTENLYGYMSGSTYYPGYDDYDNQLNVQTVFYSGGSAAFNKNISYTFYPDGSKASMVTPAGTFTYRYDAAGRPTSETNPFSETTSWIYANNNWMVGQSLGDGATTSYAYDAKALFTELKNKDGGGTVLSDFSGMAYDGAGNRKTVTAAIPSYSAYSGTTSYTDDSKNELTLEASSRNGGYSNTFAYDSAENPTTFRGSSGRSFNSDNQAAVTGYTYDGDGNPTTYNGSSFVFDAENRLTAVGSTLTAGYGADTMRAWKADSTGTAYYLYSDDSQVPVCEMNSSGTVTATNTYTVNGLTSRNSAGNSTFYEFDQQGSVSQRLNSAGACTSTSMADAFGNVINSAAVSDPFGYIGQVGYYTDQTTGLVLTAHRYYDPSAGRFLNRDPAGYQGGVNLYGYVQNDGQDSSDALGYAKGISLPIIQTPHTPGYPAPKSPHSPSSPCVTCPSNCNPPMWEYKSAGFAAATLVGAIMLAIAAMIAADPPAFLALIGTPWYGCISGALMAAADDLASGIVKNCGNLSKLDPADMSWDALKACASGAILSKLIGIISKLSFNPQMPAYWEP